CMGAANRIFGRWSAAILASGVPLNKRANNWWNKARIVSHLQDRAKRGLSIVSNDPGNACAFMGARRLGMTWADAIAAAGIPPIDRTRKWTKEKLLFEINRGPKF